MNINLALILRIALALFFFSMCRVIFYLYNLDYFTSVTFNGLLKIFYGGLVFDLSVLLLLQSPYILSQLIPFKFRHNLIYQKITIWLYIIPLSGGIIANLADTVYYQVTLKRTTSALFQQFQNETNLGKLFSQFLVDYWYMLVLAISLLSLVYWLSFQIKVGASKKTSWYVYIITHTLILLISAGLAIGGIRGGFKHSTRPITLSNASKYINKPNERSIVLNTPFAILRSANRKPLQEVRYFSDIDEQQEVYSAYHSGVDKPDSLFTNKNVVLFILESFGREHIGALNKDIPNYHGFTPFLDSLIDHSYSYKYSFANGRKSISGMPSSIASIPSLKEPFILSHYSGNRISSLAETLKKKGYHTSFFHGAPNGSMGFDAFTNQAGFDDYFGMTEYANDDDFDGTWGIWDEEFFQFYAEKMNSIKTPFFTTLFSVSSHHPFKLPERYQNTFPEGNLPIQETIGYTDYALKRFFQTAKNMPWYQNTIFVITADHASTFSDLPEYKTPSGFFAVPLIIFDPSEVVKKEINTTIAVQQIDIMPTVLEMLNYSDDYIAFGQNIMDTTVNHFALGHMSGNYHYFNNEYLLQYTGENITGMYNYANDPLFKNNLKTSDNAVQQKILRHTQAFIQEYNRRMIKDEMTISN